MEFCSEAYMEELMRRVNSDEVYLGLSKTGRDATYTLVVEEEPENEVWDSFTVGFSVVDGKIGEVWTGKPKTTQLMDLVISGKYGTWVEMLRSKLGLTDALLARKLTLAGETNQIFAPSIWMSGGQLFGVGLTAAAERLIEIARAIPTEFHGKYADKNRT